MKTLTQRTKRLTQWVLVVGVFTSVVLSACSSRSQPSITSPSRTTTDSSIAWTLTRKNDIRALWVQIRQWRQRDLKLASEPAPFSSALSTPVKELRSCIETDRSSKSGTCADTCRVKDAICDNADDICRIADELGDDAWAKEKCQSAKASCKEAKEQCCGCNAPN